MVPAARPFRLILALFAVGCARSELRAFDLDVGGGRAGTQGKSGGAGPGQGGSGFGAGGTGTGGSAGSSAGGGAAGREPCPAGLVGDDCDELAFEPLGRPPGCRAGAFTPIDLSGDGRVVVGQCRYDTILWTADDGFRVIAAEAMPANTSYDGSIVVGNLYAMQGLAHSVYRWTGDGIERLLDGTFYAAGMSDDGSIVVGTEVDRAVSHAYRLTAAGVQRLGVLAGLSHGVATATAPNGGVVVGYSHGPGAAARAFRWTVATGLTELGLVPGTASSVAWGVSDDGAVVVGSSSPYSSEGHAFRYTLTRGMVALGDLPGSTSGAATDTSADGSVVVGASCTTYAGRADSFLWDERGGLRALAAELEAAGAELDGWTLGGRPWCVGAVAVSADGKVVLGLATAPDGLETAYLARLP